MRHWFESLLDVFDSFTIYNVVYINFSFSISTCQSTILLNILILYIYIFKMSCEYHCSLAFFLRLFKVSYRLSRSLVYIKFYIIVLYKFLFHFHTIDCCWTILSSKNNSRDWIHEKRIETFIHDSNFYTIHHKVLCSFKRAVHDSWTIVIIHLFEKLIQVKTKMIFV